MVDDIMNKIGKLYEKKESLYEDIQGLYEEIEKINDEIRMNKLEKFIEFLDEQREKDMLNQNFEAHHEMMKVVVDVVSNCLDEEEVEVSYVQYTEIMINGECSFNDKEDFICLSNDKSYYLYDVISFFKEEAKIRREGKADGVWISSHKLDKFFPRIEFVLNLSLS